MRTIKTETGSGNVFADLGFPDADEHAPKAALVRQIDLLIEDRGLTQTAAAKLLGISQPDVSRMLRGQFRDYSLDRLMKFLRMFGRNIQITVSEPARPTKHGKLSMAG